MPIIDFAFCCALGAMNDLFSFDDVVKAIQGGKPQKKHSMRRLVKATSLSQGTGNN